MFPCVLTIPFSIGLFQFKYRLMVQVPITVHIAFHVVYYPYRHSGMVLILICATLDIYSKMGQIFVTSRHATLALQMISELRIPILTATFPNSLFNIPV